MNQEKYELTITADGFASTDERFSIDDIGRGDNYEPIDAYLQLANGEIIKRKRNKSENRISNQTLPRLAFQVYENQILEMADLDKRQIPVCKYKNQELIRGVYSSKEDFHKYYKKTMEYLTYWREGGPKFVIYSWNIFSTILFVQECVKRFGNTGDKFVLVYKEKAKKTESDKETSKAVEEGEKNSSQECKNKYSKILLESKNIILRGAPGTGKSYLAKQIAADIISNGYTEDDKELTAEQMQQMEFVQFHPSYDYSDFVEGLRPKMNDDGSMGFELQDGIFKRFVDKARRNYEKTLAGQDEDAKNDEVARKQIFDFLGDVEYGITEFKTVSGSSFFVTDANEKYIYISLPSNIATKNLTLSINELQRLLASEIAFEKVRDVSSFLRKEFAYQIDSYIFALYKAIKDGKYDKTDKKYNKEPLKKYIFIIDEINRGEISKILGELFFSIDPGYRGKDGSVSTQYANMHDDPDEKFYIPKNVYIIGTMNDIHRSVDTFDFAMRRRFRFIEVSAKSTQYMLESLGDEALVAEAAAKMDALNEAIVKVPDLNENYQIGASYFLKVKSLGKDTKDGFDILWTDYLKPLLQEYVRGLYNEEELMATFAKAYGYEKPGEGNTDED